MKQRILLPRPGLGLDPGLPTPWYLTTGLTLSNVAEAWQAKYARSYADSLRGLAHQQMLVESGGGPIAWQSIWGWIAYSSRYLISPIAPPSDLSGSYVARFMYAGGNTWILGCSTLNYTSALMPKGDTPGGVVAGNGAYLELVTPPVMTVGVYGMAGVRAFRNGAYEGSCNPGSVDTSYPYYIFANDFNGAPDSIMTSGYIQAVVFYTITLTDTQMTAISMQMAAL